LKHRLKFDKEVIRFWGNHC